MNVELIAFKKTTPSLSKRELMIQLFNQTKSELILFPGHSINSVSEIQNIARRLKNRNSIAFFEIKDICSRDTTNWLFKIENNRIVNCHSHQLFATSDEIDNNEVLAENLFFEIIHSRIHKVQNKKVCLLMCGELNILSNLQSEENRVVIRVKNHELKKKYIDLFKNVDIILNPIHTPMGNQGKMHRRRIFLSKNGRAYFSTGNLEKAGKLDKQAFLQIKSLQYAYLNGKQIADPVATFVSTQYISRVFEF